MPRYDLRPGLLEDALQEFELVRLQGVEWGWVKKRHRTSVQSVGQRAFPSDFLNLQFDRVFLAPLSRRGEASRRKQVSPPRHSERAGKIENAVRLGCPLSL
jgi:hypothetical protein